MLAYPLDDYLRTDRLPSVWCSGCGIGIALGAFLRAVDELKLADKTAVISGIGCAGRSGGYINMDSFHTTHGRAIPFATAVKIAKPNLKVVVFSGDGDIFAIGGNHFIHAARRNVDLLVICINNFIYGMTGGQVAPTTPSGAVSMTTPYGNIEPDFNLVSIAAATGATFVARWTIAHPVLLKATIKKALQKKGFSFIEVIATCPEQFGRYNKLGKPSEMLESLRKTSIIRRDIAPDKASITVGKEIIVGEFLDIERQEYVDRVYNLIREKTGREVQSLV